MRGSMTVLTVNMEVNMEDGNDGGNDGNSVRLVASVLFLCIRPVLDDYRNMVYAVDNAPRTSQAGKPLTAFVSFPSPYTQTLLLQALVSTLPSLSISLVPPEDEDPPALQWHVDLRACSPF